MREQHIRLLTVRRKLSSVGPRGGLQEESKFNFDADIEEPVVVDDRTILVHRVIEHDAVVGFGDFGGRLHGFRGKADLSADEAPPSNDLLVTPHSLDLVRVLNRGVGEPFRDSGNELAGPVSFGELAGDLVDRCSV